MADENEETRIQPGLLILPLNIKVHWMFQNLPLHRINRRARLANERVLFWVLDHIA